MSILDPIQFQGKTYSFLTTIQHPNGRTVYVGPNEPDNEIPSWEAHSMYSLNNQSMRSFMSVAHEGKYLPQTLDEIQYSNYWVAIALSTKFELDELTEKATGGIGACAVILRDDRLVLAVRDDLRRNEIGTRLLRASVKVYQDFLADTFPDDKILGTQLRSVIAGSNFGAMKFFEANNVAYVSQENGYHLSYPLSEWGKKYGV